MLVYFFFAIWSLPNKIRSIPKDVSVNLLLEKKVLSVFKENVHLSVMPCRKF